MLWQRKSEPKLPDGATRGAQARVVACTRIRNLARYHLTSRRAVEFVESHWRPSVARGAGRKLETFGFNFVLALLQRKRRMSRTHFWSLLSSTRQFLSLGLPLGLALASCSDPGGETPLVTGGT